MTGVMLPFAGMLAQATQPVVEGSTNIWMFVGQLGAALALGLAAIGSSIGIGVAGQSAAGAWAKEAKAGLGLRFTYIILLGMPISQTIYAMIVMNRIRDILMRTPPGEGAVTAALTAPTMSFAGVLLAAGIAVGLAELFSAWMQGKIGAAGIRAICEGEGKGFAFMIIAMGVVETVGIFAMVFALGLLPKIAKVAG